MPISMHRIAEVSALETLDSQGRPTLHVSVTLADGAYGRAAIPLEGSTSSRDASELWSSHPHRSGRAGAQHAVASIQGKISSCLVGPWWPGLSQIDAAMTELDRTADEKQPEASAIAGVSMACAQALARSAGVQLWQWLAPHGVPPRLPVPHFPVVTRAAHHADRVDFQEIMITPLGARSLPSAFQAGTAVYGVLRSLLAGKGYSTGLGDEDGFAPQILKLEDVLELLMTAIAAAGYESGPSGIAIALDLAASRFRRADGCYEIAGKALSTSEMIERYTEITERFPVWLIEDGLAEDDWDGWAELTRRLGHRVQLAGDAIFMTSPAIIREASSKSVGNAAVIKLSQAGTVTDTLQAMAACRHSNYAQLISQPPDETSDAFVADLAVSSGSGGLKIGTPPRRERAGEPNRLLGIAADQPQMAYGPKPS